jgi:hypothetical protein
VVTKERSFGTSLAALTHNSPALAIFHKNFHRAYQGKNCALKALRETG